MVAGSSPIVIASPKPPNLLWGKMPPGEDRQKSYTKRVHDHSTAIATLIIILYVGGRVGHYQNSK